MEREKVKETEGIKDREKKCLYPVVDERGCGLSLKMFEVKTNLRAKLYLFCFKYTQFLPACVCVCLEGVFR